MIGNAECKMQNADCEWRRAARYKQCLHSEFCILNFVEEAVA